MCTHSFIGDQTEQLLELVDHQAQLDMLVGGQQALEGAQQSAGVVFQQVEQIGRIAIGLLR